MAEWPDPRSVTVGFAFGHTAYEDPTGLTYEQVAPNPDDDTDPGDVLDTVIMERGRIGDAAETTPTRIMFALRDTGGKYSPRNVTGEHYGELRRGTPVRVAMDGGFGSQPLATAFVPSWSPERDGPDLDEQMPIEALGILARISRDSEARSPLRRSILSLADPVERPVDYWPMEDGTQGGQFASAIPGGQPMSVTDAELASGVDLPGSAPLPEFTATTALSATITGTLASSLAWSFGWMAKFDTLPASGTTLLDVRTSGGDGVRWVASLNGATLTITSYDAAGATVHSDTATTVVAGEWLSFFMIASESGAGAFAVAVYDADGNPLAIALDSGLTDAGTPTGILVPASAQLVGMAMGHVFLSNAATGPDYLTTSPTALSAYAGETALARIDRICDEDGIPLGAIGGGDTPAMGPQPIASTSQILRECEDTDGGVLFELRNGGLSFTPNAAVYNDVATATFTFGTQEEPGRTSGLRQIDDDRDLYNLVEVAQPDGTFAVAEQVDGPLGTNTTTGVGPRRMPRQFRNLYLPGDLPQHAGWLLRKGTIDKPRYIVVIDFFSVLPEFGFALPELDIRFHIRITGADPSHEGPDDIDLVIEGERIVLDADRLLVTWWCEPFEPWRVQQLADTPPADNVLDGWLTPTTMTVDGSDFDAGTDTSMDIAVSPAISTDASLMPLRIKALGWVGEVTNVGAPSAGVQTLTITQTPLNGVEKTIPAGTAVELVDPLVLAL